jgi:hypothetical protein
MMPEVSPVRADKRIGDSAAEHVAAPRTRVTPNTLIALASIAALVAALIFLELRIRNLAIDFSVVRGSGTAKEAQPQLAGKVELPQWQ